MGAPSSTAVSVECSLPYGRWCNAHASDRLHWTFLAHWCCQVTNGFLRHSGSYAALVGMLHGPILFCTILVHELAHLYMCKGVFGNVPTHVVIWPAGGLTQQPSTSVAQDWKIAIAGPLSHVPQILVWTGIYAATTNATFDTTFTAGIIKEELNSIAGFAANLTAQAVWINVFILLFNLVELGYPLDGASILGAVLTNCCSLRIVALSSDLSSLVVGLILLVWSLYDVIFDDNNGIGILGLFVIGYVVVTSSYHIWVTRSGNIALHPLVTKSCYRDIEDDVSGTEGKSERGEVEAV